MMKKLTTLTLVGISALTLGLSTAFAEKTQRPSKEEILKKFDADGDGVLSEDEKKAAKAAMKGKRPSKEDMLKKFDTDGDGELSEAEKEAMKAKKAEMVAKFDTDGDGELSEEERKAAREAKKAQKGN